jgi:hypothetical protein
MQMDAFRVAVAESAEIGLFANHPEFSRYGLRKCLTGSSHFSAKAGHIMCEFPILGAMPSVVVVHLCAIVFRHLPSRQLRQSEVENLHESLAGCATLQA